MTAAMVGLAMSAMVRKICERPRGAETLVVRSTMSIPALKILQAVDDQLGVVFVLEALQCALISVTFRCSKR
jgi:hypothetical protein